MINRDFQAVCISGDSAILQSRHPAQSLSRLHGQRSESKFIEEGTDVDIEDDMGWTPLYWAASMGEEAVSEFLLSKGAQASIKTKDEVTPLHQAAKVGASGLVKLLISKGADVNGSDKWGNTL